MKVISLFLVSSVLFVGCSKSSIDKEAPNIAITSPTDHQSFTAGQIVSVAALVTDEGEIHEVHIFVKNKATSADVVHVAEHPDAKTFNVFETFTAQAGVTYTIEIEADDHAGNGSHVQIEVTGK